jgi:hypothetical protein
MAIIKLKEMLIQIVKEDSGEIRANVTNADKISLDEITRMDKNLNLLIQAFTPSPEYFGMPFTNAIALWLVKGFGHHAEIIRYDEPSIGSEYVR